jgi:hypothetical protein
LATAGRAGALSVLAAADAERAAARRVEDLAGDFLEDFVFFAADFAAAAEPLPFLEGAFLAAVFFAAPLAARRFAPVFVPSPFGVAAATAATGAMAAAGVSSRVIRGAFPTEVASLALSSFIPSS